MFLFMFLLSIFSFHFSELVTFSCILVFVFSLISQGDYISATLSIDEISKNLILLSFFVGGMILSISSEKKKSLKPTLISFSLLIILLFFLTDSFIVFFVTLEMSLIPLMLLIFGWGKQAERIFASQFLVLFTIIASSPLFLSIIWMGNEMSTIISWLSINDFSKFNPIMILGIISFLVKIPVYFFHSWLPKAHVEAPLEGSMILAGLMLKVGMYGMMRFLETFQMIESLMILIFSFSFIGTMISFIIALSSDDMKMSVAFSSISHMNLIVAAFSSLMWSGGESSMIIMIAHGISSPLLFYLVTSIYQFSGSRSVLISKGVFSKIPVLWMIGVILWVINFSAPPFLPFIGELMAFNSIFKVSLLTPLWIFFLVILSSFFSMVNFGVQSHSSHKTTLKGFTEKYDLIIYSFTCSVLLIFLFFFGMFF